MAWGPWWSLIRSTRTLSPRMSDSSTYSWRVAVVILPTRSRKSIAVNHSSPVGRVSLAKSCRCRTSSTNNSRVRRSGQPSKVLCTSLVIVSSVRSIDMILPSSVGPLLSSLTPARRGSEAVMLGGDATPGRRDSSGGGGPPPKGGAAGWPSSRRTAVRSTPARPPPPGRMWRSAVRPEADRAAPSRAGRDHPHLPGRLDRPGTSGRARVGGGPGESWTATASRSPTSRAGWPGNSDATWESGPMPSISTSNAGTGP